MAAGAAAFVAVQGMVLACTFAVSHNVAEAKIPEDTGGEAYERDWGVQQVRTSAVGPYQILLEISFGHANPCFLVLMASQRRGEQYLAGRTARTGAARWATSSRAG